MMSVIVLGHNYYQDLGIRQLPHFILLTIKKVGAVLTVFHEEMMRQ